MKQLKHHSRKYRHHHGELDYHKLSLDELEGMFSTSLRHGMDDTKAAKVRIKRGENKLSSEQARKALRVLGYLVQDVCSLLWVTCVMSIIIYFYFSGSSPDETNLVVAAACLVLVLASTAIYVYQDLHTASTVARVTHQNKLVSLNNNTTSVVDNHLATVIRNGEDKVIGTEELVVGDLIYLNAGQLVPADVRLIECRQLEFDRSTLTGEFERVAGSLDALDEHYLRAANIAMMSTMVTCGEGKGIVVCKGDQTALGKLNEMSYNVHSKNINLDDELQKFANLIIVFSIIMSISTLVWMLTFMRISYPAQLTFDNLVSNAISSLTAFVPNALPLTLAASLLIIRFQMVAQKVYLKSASILETFSCTNMLACDKTGTLTQNRMSVTHATTGAEAVQLDELKFRGKIEFA